MLSKDVSLHFMLFCVTVLKKSKVKSHKLFKQLNCLTLTVIYAINLYCLSENNNNNNKKEK